MLLGNIIDELHDNYGFADTRAAEQADLAALQERLNQVNDFDSGLEHFRRRRLLLK